MYADVFVHYISTDMQIPSNTIPGKLNLVYILTVATLL